jgi:ABC-type branched-subunit amino acid transport system ATPase component
MTVLIVEPDVLVALEQADRGDVLDVEHITMTGSA